MSDFTENDASVFLQFFSVVLQDYCCKYWVGKSNSTSVRVFLAIVKVIITAVKSFYSGSILYIIFQGVK